MLRSERQGSAPPGAALYAANVVSSIEAGIARAREVLASGAAKAKLAQLVAVAHQLSTP